MIDEDQKAESTQWLIKFAVFEGVSLVLAFGAWFFFFKGSMPHLMLFVGTVLGISTLILIKKLMSFRSN